MYSSLWRWLATWSRNFWTVGNPYALYIGTSAVLVLSALEAVDANVLIFERIKEEKKKNIKTLASIKNGFDKAISTILDANITTLIAALILFVFGSGPIKGFSITLSLGILASMFTAIMFTNFLIYMWFAYSSKKVINL